MVAAQPKASQAQLLQRSPSRRKKQAVSTSARYLEPPTPTPPSPAQDDDGDERQDEDAFFDEMGGDSADEVEDDAGDNDGESDNDVIPPAREGHASSMARSVRRGQ